MSGWDAATCANQCDKLRAWLAAQPLAPAAGDAMPKFSYARAEILATADSMWGDAKDRALTPDDVAAWNKTGPVPAAPPTAAREAVAVNHDEALQLAHLKRDESNLARCYIALREAPAVGAVSEAIVERACASLYPSIWGECSPVTRKYLSDGMRAALTAAIGGGK